MKTIAAFSLVILSSFIQITASAQTLTSAKEIDPRSYTATEVFKGDDVIWGFDFLSENEMLITQKDGAIFFFDLKSGKKEKVSGGPNSIVKGQGGLLDIKVHRDGGKTWIFMTSAIEATMGEETDRQGKQTTGLFRGEWSVDSSAQSKAGASNSPSIHNLKKIFEAEPAVDSGHHFGSRLAFPNGGGIMMTIGERNQRERAQDLSQHWGKVVQLALDGKPYPANPFLQAAEQKKAINGQVPRPEIYSYGHRNPQGIAIHPITHKIFVSEHGPRGGDEINWILPGKNYGWPIITYGREYSGPKIGTTEKAGLEQPLKYYVPSIAPGSLLAYSGKKYPELRGALIQTALVLQHLNILMVTMKDGVPSAGKEHRFFEDLHERLRHVAESPAGEIYFSTDSGRILKLARKQSP